MPRCSTHFAKKEVHSDVGKEKVIGLDMAGGLDGAGLMSRTQPEFAVPIQ